MKYVHDACFVERWLKSERASIQVTLSRKTEAVRGAQLTIESLQEDIQELQKSLQDIDAFILKNFPEEASQ